MKGRPVDMAALLETSRQRQGGFASTRKPRAAFESSGTTRAAGRRALRRQNEFEDAALHVGWGGRASETIERRRRRPSTASSLSRSAVESPGGVLNGTVDGRTDGGSGAVEIEPAKEREARSNLERASSDCCRSYTRPFGGEFDSALEALGRYESLKDGAAGIVKEERRQLQLLQARLLLNAGTSRTPWRSTRTCWMGWNGRRSGRCIGKHQGKRGGATIKRNPSP